MEECSPDLIFFIKKQLDHLVFLVVEGQLFFPIDETRFSKIK